MIWIEYCILASFHRAGQEAIALYYKKTITWKLWATWQRNMHSIGTNVVNKKFFCDFQVILRAMDLPNYETNVLQISARFRYKTLNARIWNLN